MKRVGWIVVTAAVVIWTPMSPGALAQGPVQHTINVTVRGGSPCGLATDLPNGILSAHPGDRIVLQVAGNVPASCGVPGGARPGMADFKMNGNPVAPPVSAGNGAYVVNSGRNGRYKFSVVLGSLVLDPELEIN